MVDYLLDTFSQHFWQLCTHFRRNGKNYSVVTVRTERQAAIIHFQLGLASQALFLDEFKRSVLVIATWALNVVVLIMLLLFFFIVFEFL